MGYVNLSSPKYLVDRVQVVGSVWIDATTQTVYAYVYYGYVVGGQFRALETISYGQSGEREFESVERRGSVVLKGADYQAYQNYVATMSPADAVLKVLLDNNVISGTLVQ
jgi:hypothetical protein